MMPSRHIWQLNLLPAAVALEQSRRTSSARRNRFSLEQLVGPMVQTIFVFLTLLSSSEVVTVSGSTLMRLADLSVPASCMEIPPPKPVRGLDGAASTATLLRESPRSLQQMVAVT